MKRILLAVDDSPAGLAAARTAIGLAGALQGILRAIHVVPGDAMAQVKYGGADLPSIAARRDEAASALLRYVMDLGKAAGLSPETHSLLGKPARAILEDATLWRADLIVIGRAGGRHLGEHYVGSEVQRVLEFTEIPVLVVPAETLADAVGRGVPSHPRAL